MAIHVLGKMQSDSASVFVQSNPSASFGSMSSDGLRRIKGPLSLRQAFIEAGGITKDSVPPVLGSDCLTCEQKRLGDAIKDRLVEETRDTTVCDECQAEIDRLNTMTADEVLEEAPALADRITERAKTKAKSVIHRTAAAVLPGIVSSKVQGWIEDTVNNVNNETENAKSD